MIDFHSHMLPGIDDGAQDVNTSLQMLTLCQDSGVSTVLMTPHCHPRSQAHVDNFTEKRDDAFRVLTASIEKEKKTFPNIVPAAEIRIYDGFHKYKGIEKLCIKDTNYILLEMPYEVWKDYAFEEIYQITRLGFRPLMAHLDRFLDQEHLFHEIFALDVAVQMNTSAFLGKATRRKMLKFFETGHLQVIGSDTHDLFERKPNVAEAYNIIANKFGKEYAGYIDYAGQAILNNETVYPPKFSKMSAFKKMMI